MTEQRHKMDKLNLQSFIGTFLLNITICIL